MPPLSAASVRHPMTSNSASLVPYDSSAPSIPSASSTLSASGSQHGNESNHSRSNSNRSTTTANIESSADAASVKSKQRPTFKPPKRTRSHQQPRAPSQQKRGQRRPRSILKTEKRKPRTNDRITINVSASTVRRIPSWREMSSSVIRSVWYFDDDYDDMMYDNDRVLQRMMDGERFRPDDNRVCGRGLENQLPERNEKRQQHKRSVVRIVLLEQTKQLKIKQRKNRRGSSGSSNTASSTFNKVDDAVIMAIGAAAGKATKRAREHAQAMGAQDADIVQGMWGKHKATPKKSKVRSFLRSVPGRTVSAMARSKKTVAAQEAAALAIMGRVAKDINRKPPARSASESTPTRSPGPLRRRLKLRQQTKKKEVRFAQRVAARKVTHLNDMPAPLQAAVWYQQDELKRMKADRKRSLQYPVDDIANDICLRGTECVQEKDQRRAHKVQVRKAVLKEQSRHRKASPTSSNDSAKHKPSRKEVEERWERIREASVAVTQKHLLEAMAMGKADERAAHDIRSEFNPRTSLRSLGRSSLRSSRRLLDGLKELDEADADESDQDAKKAPDAGDNASVDDNASTRSSTSSRRQSETKLKSKPASETTTSESNGKPKSTKAPASHKKKTKRIRKDSAASVESSDSIKKQGRVRAPPRRTASSSSSASSRRKALLPTTSSSSS